MKSVKLKNNEIVIIKKLIRIMFPMGGLPPQLNQLDKDTLRDLRTKFNKLEKEINKNGNNP